jgi:hypothetical protein
MENKDHCLLGDEEFLERESQGFRKGRKGRENHR